MKDCNCVCEFCTCSEEGEISLSVVKFKRFADSSFEVGVKIGDCVVDSRGNKVSWTFNYLILDELGDLPILDEQEGQR